MGGFSMKQTKKLTRSQREFLTRKCSVNDVTVYRLVEETKENLCVMSVSENKIICYDKETGNELYRKEL